MIVEEAISKAAASAAVLAKRFCRATVRYAQICSCQVMGSLIRTIEVEPSAKCHVQTHVDEFRTTCDGGWRIRRRSCSFWV